MTEHKNGYSMTMVSEKSCSVEGAKNKKYTGTRLMPTGISEKNKSSHFSRKNKSRFHEFLVDNLSVKFGQFRLDPGLPFGTFERLDQPI